MKSRHRRITSPAAAWIVVLSASAAFAAPDQGAGQGSDPESGEQPSAANLSAQGTLTQAKDYQSKMQDSLRTVVQLQDMSKKQKDIIKLNCVNDKLIQLKGNIAVGDQALSSLNEAVAKNDDGGRVQEYTRITILYQKVLLLTTEAKNCVGEDLSYIGALSVKVTVDETVPQKDFTGFAFPAFDTERPPVASASL